LVKQEKEIEETLQTANKQAASIIDSATEQAQRMLQEAEDPRVYDKIFNEKLKEIEAKKKIADEEINRKIQRIHEAANKNLERTVSFVVKHVLEG